MFGQDKPVVSIDRCPTRTQHLRGGRGHSQHTEVVKEVLEAGFVLDGQSDLLANQADAHAIRVFDPTIKGETDRIAYRFIRP